MHDFVSVLFIFCFSNTKPQIFKTTTEFEFERLSGRMDELAFLNAGVSIVMADAR